MRHIVIESRRQRHAAPFAGGAHARAIRLPIRSLGRTGLPVSAMGLGLAGLGRPAYMALGRQEHLGSDRSVAAMRARCHAVLDAAYAAGIRYIDTARSYGLAEAFVRDWCEERQVPEDGVTIGSKWGYIYTGAWQADTPRHEVKRLTLDTLRWQAAESRAILGARLSLYQIHSATIGSGVLDHPGVLSELCRLRAQGLVIGLTVTGPNQPDAIRRALEVSIDGVPLFGSVQATWNLLEPSAGEALAEAHASGCAVILKEVLANGRLTHRYAGPALQHCVSRAAAMGTTIETLATSAALRQPWATVVLSGAVTCGQLQQHVAAVDDVGDAAACVAAEPPELYWRTRSVIPWQ
jgi:aryl-alcohol dehydrogenase-like predicted oxidoreductase